MVKEKPINSWVLLGLTRKEIFVGILVFILSGMFFRTLGRLIWRKRPIMLRDKAAVLRPKINELTIQELQGDLDDLELRLDGLNNDFLSQDKSLMENTERFRSINKEYLELRLRLNHIMHELEKDENNKYNTDNVELYNNKMERMKGSLDLLNEELQRETNENQSYTLNMLTLIETIFLPLGVLTGYFGMNFSSMGGHVGVGHKAAPGILGVRYGQGFVWGIMLLCTIIIFYSFNWSKMEHFDIRETQKCNKERIVNPYNERMHDLKKIPTQKLNINQNMFEMPYDSVNFYTDQY
jgi:hypothetical protein